MKNPLGAESREAMGVIERYREYLPVSSTTPIVTLNEGSTPLLHSPHLSDIVGRDCNVYLKYEGLNPTGSFKDRGMTVAVSKAKEEGAQLLICASTGNTSASAAAYAARGGLRCAVLLPTGKIATGKLVQAFVYGAAVIGLEGNFDQCLDLIRELANEPGIAVVNSINPHRLAGQKTAAFEVAEALGDAPDIHILPLGNAGNTAAYWQGYSEFYELGRASRLPRMVAFEAAGAAPIYYDRKIAFPETRASAIRIGNPASWKLAKNALRQSNGTVDIVSDEEIFAAQSWLATHEGIFVEPASAASVAGLFKCRRGPVCDSCPLPQIPDGATIVCTLTGHGLKDVAAIMTDNLRPAQVVATKDAVLSFLSRPP
ncbi:MAG: threonine synthase [Verrucomicrobia bacterium]|nr:threonine synthase [Verrucomicrobiota bacterium]